MAAWRKNKLLQFGENIVGSVAFSGTPSLLHQHVSNFCVAGARWRLPAHPGTIRCQQSLGLTGFFYPSSLFNNTQGFASLASMPVEII